MTYFSYDIKSLALMPPRPVRSNKGDFGRLLVVAGSRGMTGAAYFAATAAYRIGAGLVEIFTHSDCVPTLQTLIPEAVITSYGDDYRSDLLLASVARADAVVIGCGMGQTSLSRAILSDLLRNRGERPTVIDADGLNLLAKNPSLLRYAKGAVITPHFAEMSRLTSISIEEIASDTPRVAYDLAAKHSLVCVLKDHETAVSDGGDSIYINKRGNSGMATGGSGDVLAGIIGGILCQAARRDSGEDVFTYACLGVYIHSVSGDIAAASLGEYSVMARDIIDAIPKVLKKK